MPTVRICRIDAWACRYPVRHPVCTSFGTMRDRPAVFVRLEDQHGCFGFGEIFCNWPAAGAEHRVNLLIQDIAELLAGKDFMQPRDLWVQLEAATSIRVLQCGEPGPFRQVIAGLDIAIWDLFARRAGQTLRHMIQPLAADQVAAYASGIHIRDAERSLDRLRVQNFRQFKLKVGFDPVSDMMKLKCVAAKLVADEGLSVDANQAWNLGEARAFFGQLGSLALQWVEEPLRADAPVEDWKKLAQITEIPLAAGENIAGLKEFTRVIDSTYLAVIQPDVIKWGGISGCLGLAKASLSAGKRYCPHYLGGGIGLLASAELLAAVGGDGLLEVDVNDNPLRDAFVDSPRAMSNGTCRLGHAPGLGVEALPESISEYVTLYRSWNG